MQNIVNQTKPNSKAVANCIYCQTSSKHVLYPTTDIFGDTYKVCSCPNCQAIFLWPQPSVEQLARAYDDSYYGEQDTKFNPLIERVLDFFRSKRANIIKRFVNAPAKVLDIGCGNGNFLQYVQQKGNYDIYGIELPGKAAKRATQIPNIKLKEGQLETDDFPANYFDAITLFHVFEHLSKPQETLHTIRKILKPGGICIISFPNIDSWQSRWFKGKWLHLDPPRHLFFFKPEDFVALMNDLGFSLLKEKHFNTEYNPFGMQQSLLNTISPKRELLYEHLKGNKQYTQEYPSWKLKSQDLFFKLSAPIFIILDALESATSKGATVEFVFRKDSIS